MKLIGITGSFGKTSVAEIVYQYMLFKGYNTSLYSSNGLFLNGLTREKDFLQTTLYHKDLEKLLKEDEENIDYAIIEITAESVKRQDRVHELLYEVICLNNFYGNLHNHFDSKDDYYQCKRNILQNAKKLLLRIDDPNYSMFSDLEHITFGYAEGANHRLQVINNEIDGLTLNYQNVIFKTNLITAYNARNMACALAILSEVNELNMEEFSKFALDIFIRGRFEKFICKNKNVLIDTGYAGIDLILNGLEKTIGNSNYKMIYSSIHYNKVTDWVKQARKRVGKHLTRSKYIYLTSPKSRDNEVDIFLNDVIGKDYKNYEYITNIKEACFRAIEQLNDDELLIIIAREHYREYRKALEEINSLL